MTTISLVTPHVGLVPSYLEALREGKFITMQLGFGDASPDEIAHDPAAYIRKITNPEPYSVTYKNKQYTVTEHELLWLTDGTRFLGTVALRYRGDDTIMKDYAGHVGMAIRPGLIGKGYGIKSIQHLADVLAGKMKQHGLASIYATCDADNQASQRLIEHFGGKLVDASNERRIYKIDL